MVRRLLFLAFVIGCSSSPVPNLDSSDPYERYLGALEASESGDPEGWKRVEALLKDPDPLARTGAVVALGQARPEGSLKLLTGMLSDADPGVREEAVRYVASFKDPKSVVALIKILEDDASINVRRTAALVLGDFPDSPPLREALLDRFDDKAAGVAFNAYKSLVRITKRTDLPRSRAPAEEALKRS